jgi:phage gpG-like protein
MGKAFLEIKQIFTPPNLKKKMEEAGNRSKDLRPWLEQAGLVALSSIQLNQFRASGTPKWPGLKFATIIRRRDGDGGGLPKPLLDTGVLVNSFISGVESKGAGRSPELRQGGNLKELTKSRLVVGTALKYAHFHQFGTARMVARPFNRILNRDELIMKKLLVDYLKEGDS